MIESFDPRHDLDLGSAPRLGVNIDHVATLRQLRGTPYPSLIEAAQCALAGGASQITVHLREDRRHIQDADVPALRKFLKNPYLLNLEMAPTPEMTRIAKKIQPDWVCLVPEKRNEVTTEGGLDLKRSSSRVAAVVKALRKTSTRVSLFVEPDVRAMEKAHALGAHAVELHTGAYCLARGARRSALKKKLAAAAEKAAHLGLRVHAGHGLDASSVRELLDLEAIVEFNIGHSIVCRSVFVGLEVAVREMVAALAAP